jgi:hypothetical protein
VNKIHAPAYKISKFLAKKLNDYLKLKNYNNVEKSTNFANDLIKLKIHNNYKMITFYIKDLYVNIPICEALDITKNLLLRHNDEHISKKNGIFITYNSPAKLFLTPKQYFPTQKAIAMGYPISDIIAEIFLQFHENRHLDQLLDEMSIIIYTRYVDNIFIMYNTDRNTPDKIHVYPNNLHPNLEFTPTVDENNRISFLDLLITRQP